MTKERVRGGGGHHKKEGKDGGDRVESSGERERKKASELVRSIHFL